MNLHALLKSVDVDVLTCGPPVKAWVFLNGELIIDVVVNAVGAKMSKKNRKK